MNAPEKSTGASLNRYKSEQEVATDPALIRAVVARFGRIGFDLAASDKNSQSGPSYFSKKDDSLSRDWAPIGAETLWLNCEFADIAPWAKKCREESAKKARRWRRILLLTPASVGANWFKDDIHGHAYVLALNGRLTFVGHKQPYPRDCILSVYDGTRGFDCWDWKGSE